MYEYWADVVSVHDGDTITANVDLGFKIWRVKQHMRLAGISARELSMPGGVEAADNLKKLLTVGQQLKIQSAKLGNDPEDLMSFDRYVVNITLPTGQDLAAKLVADGWAVLWDGKTKPIPYPIWPRML